MSVEFRRWLFGGSVGFFVLVAVLFQLALEWRRTHETVSQHPAGVPSAPTPAPKDDALGQSFEAIDKMDGTDPVRLQRAQQKLIDEARKAGPRYHELFARRLETVDSMPAARALALAEAFFASARDEEWATVGKFLTRHEHDWDATTCVTLRTHFLERLRRNPPGPGARPHLDGPLAHLVQAASSLTVARVAAEAYLSLYQSDGEREARGRLRQWVLRRPPSEHSVFADLVAP